MRKLLMLFTVAATIVSCKNEPQVDYAILSGTILNKSADDFTINSLDRSFKKVIEVAADGSFTDTLKVDAGTYMLYDGKNFTNVHLDHGNSIAVNFDAKDFKNTIAFTGIGAEISNYLLAKGNKQKEMMGEGTAVYQLEEAEYKARFNAIKTTVEEMIASTEGISEDYKIKEKRNLNYSYLNKLSIYKSYHSYYAKKPDLEVSEEFLSDLDGIAYDSEDDYNFSQDYKSLVSSHFYKEATDLAKTDSIEQDIAMLKVASAITAESIKNGLLYENAKYNVTYTTDLEGFYQAFMAGSTNEAHKKEITESYNTLKTVAKGQPSPKFVDYENYAGGTTSLDDLKGKYVYIDVWATWCGPCKREIPFLKEVESNYHGKNIEFVSLSIDKEKDHEAWKKMIVDKELGGIQVFADNDWNSKFVQDYLIKGIPRFILVDPNGDIVNSNAPRPSEEKLVALFEELEIK